MSRVVSLCVPELSTHPASMFVSATSSFVLNTAEDVLTLYTDKGSILARIKAFYGDSAAADFRESTQNRRSSRRSA